MRKMKRFQTIFLVPLLNIMFPQCMLKYQWCKCTEYFIKFYVFLALFQITSFWYQDRYLFLIFRNQNLAQICQKYQVCLYIIFVLLWNNITEFTWSAIKLQFRTYFLEWIELKWEGKSHNIYHVVFFSLILVSVEFFF